MPLSSLTTIKVGGVARYYGQPSTLEELKYLLDFAKDKDIPLFILGGGSNTVFGDFEGLVINMKGFTGMHVESLGETYKVTAFAGTPLKEIIKLALRKNLEGIYRLAGFPATVGGAVSMNAGAFSVEIRDFLEEVEFLSWNGETVRAKAEELRFGYRISPFPEIGVVLRCTFKLRRSDKDVTEEYRGIVMKRKKSQPINLPTCGSTFKNPYPFYAGELLEKVKLKGERFGGVAFSEKHANFLVNLGWGKTADVKKALQEAKRRVFEEFGIRLQEEVRIVESGGSYGGTFL